MRKMLPSARELDEFWKHSSAIDQVEMRVVGEEGLFQGGMEHLQSGNALGRI